MCLPAGFDQQVVFESLATLSQDSGRFCFHNQDSVFFHVPFSFFPNSAFPFKIYGDSVIFFNLSC